MSFCGFSGVDESLPAEAFCVQIRNSSVFSEIFHTSVRTFKPKSLFEALKRKIETHGSAYDLSASLMPLPKSSS